MGSLVSAVGRRRPLFVGVVFLVTMLAIVGANALPTRYMSKVTLRVATPGTLSGDGVRADATDYFNRLQNTYAALASSHALREAVAVLANVRGDLIISLSPRPSSELMDLRAEAGTAPAAQRAADAAAALLISRVKDLGVTDLAVLDASSTASITALEADVAKSRDERDTLAKTPNPSDAVRARLRQLDADIDVKSSALSQQQASYQELRRMLVARSNLVSVIGAASPPSSSRLGFAAVLALAIAAAISTGLSVVAVLERVRRRVDGRLEVEQLSGATVVAEIRAPSRRYRCVLGADEPASDAFRRLRTDVLVRAEQQAVHSILVASPHNTPVTAWVASNLAVALARVGHRVALVDVTTGPSLLASERAVPVGALVEALRDESDVERALAPTATPGLRVASGAGVSTETRDLVTPARIGKAIAGFEAGSEIVVVTTPGLLAGAEVLAYASAIPNVLLVVGRRQTTRAQVAEARQHLLDVRASVLGVVLTRRTRWGRRR